MQNFIEFATQDITNTFAIDNSIELMFFNDTESFFKTYSSVEAAKNDIVSKHKTYEIFNCSSHSVTNK